MATDNCLRLDTVPRELLSCNLGKCIGAFQDVTRFNYKFLLWLLLPFAGIVVVLFYLILYAIGVFVSGRERVYVFERGFIYERLRPDGSVKKRRVFGFNNVTDMDFRRTNNFTNGIYSSTECDLKVHYYDPDTDRQRKFKMHSAERNRYNDPDRWQFGMIAMAHVFAAWKKYSKKG